MGRKNRRAKPPKPRRPWGGFQTPEHHPDGDWQVRAVSAQAAAKVYRCPGCDQEIRPGVAHVVVWRADRPHAEEDRRHWHTPCWRARARRRPTR